MRNRPLHLARTVILAVSISATVVLAQDIYPKPHMGDKDSPNLRQPYGHLLCYSGGEKVSCGDPDGNKQLSMSGDGFRILINGLANALDKIGGKKKEVREQGR